MEVTKQARLTFENVDILEVKFSIRKPFSGNHEVNMLVLLPPFS